MRMIFKLKPRASACALGVAALLLIAIAGRPAGSHRTSKKPAGQHDTSVESSARPVIESTDETNDLDSNREKEFFRDWVGGELDVETTRKMWDQALSVPSEPPSKSLQAVDSWQL